MLKKILKRIESRRNSQSNFWGNVVSLKDFSRKLITKISRVWYRFNKRGKIRKYLETHKIKKVHLGCGSSTLKGWLNSDLIPVPGKGIISINVSKRLPFKDSSIDYIFFEHLIEHITFQEGSNLLEECFRVLKPSGKIRVATPDIKFLVELYNKRKTNLQEEYLNWAMEKFVKNKSKIKDTFVINHFFYGFEHKFIYDPKTLKQSMEKAKFTQIKRVDPNKSTNKNLRNIDCHGKAIGKRFNALEIFILEAAKDTK